MSAIAGVLRLDDRPVNPDEVSAMLAVMSYRGTGPPRISTVGAVCIGGLSRGVPAPVWQAGSEQAIAADARIDNVSELARELGVDESTPAEMLLSRAYRAWGEGCAQRLLGDFALAIWDENRQRLVCVRDHFGVRPLHYCHLPGRLFAFASEAKALFTLPELVVRVDETRIAEFLADSYTDSQRTFYKDVRRLPPAHTMTVTSAGVTVRCFWTLDPSRTVRHSSDAEYADAFREIFTDAVHCRLRAADGLGVMLSGGLDSSSITCVAQDLLRKGPQQLSTFSVIYSDAPQGDEREFIAAVTRTGDLRDDYLDIADLSPLRHLERVTFHHEGPAHHPRASDLWELYEQVAAGDVGVLLDGSHGDATISHNFRYLVEFAHLPRWRSMLRETRGLSRHYYNGKVSSRRLLMSYCIPLLLPSWGWLAQARRDLRAIIAPERGARSLIAEGFAARCELPARLEAYQNKMGSLRTFRDVHAYSLTLPVLPYGLEYIDMLCAPFAIEHRHPFCDKRLVEFCLALPREQLMQNGWAKSILRRGLADLLPSEVRRRRGKGTSIAQPSYGSRLARFERGVLEDTARDGDVLGEYLDMERLRTAIQRYLDDGAFADDSAIWPAVSLRLWLRSTAFKPGAPIAA